MQPVAARPAAQRVVAPAAVEGVVAFAAVQGVVTAAAVEGIVTFTAVERVVARIALQPVAARPAAQRVVALAAVEGVVAFAAVEGVVALATVEAIVPRAATQHIVAALSTEGAALVVGKENLIGAVAGGIAVVNIEIREDFFLRLLALRGRHPGSQPVESVPTGRRQGGTEVAHQFDKVGQGLSGIALVAAVKQRIHGGKIQSQLALPVDGDQNLVAVLIQAGLLDQFDVGGFLKLLVALLEQIDLMLRDAHKGVLFSGILARWGQPDLSAIVQRNAAVRDVNKRAAVEPFQFSDQADNLPLPGYQRLLAGGGGA